MNNLIISRITVLLLFTLYWVTQTVQAQNNGVSINPYSQSIVIGEQVRVELNVATDSSKTVIWPEFLDTITTQIEIIEAHPIDTVYADTLLQQKIIGYQKKWTITSFDSGLWAFPEVTVWIDSVPYTTDAFLFEVNTVVVDTAKGFIDIVEPIDLPMTFLEYVQAYYHYALWAYGLVVLMAILAYIFGSDFKRTEQEEFVETIAPHILALSRLDQLASEQLWQQGAFKAYHIQVSDIVREYIENRFQIPVKESTTDEIKHLLKLTRMEKSLRIEIINSLKISDLAKFAKAIPNADENEASLETAYKLVDLTTIVESTQNETENE